MYVKIKVGPYEMNMIHPSVQTWKKESRVKIKRFVNEWNLDSPITAEIAMVSCSTLTIGPASDF
jgi:hypothetical protein